jgi:hypothetical protein
LPDEKRPRHERGLLLSGMRWYLKLLLAVAVTGCGPEQSNAELQNDTARGAAASAHADPDTAGARRARTGVVFDPTTVRRGDTVGSLTVSNITFQTALDSTVLGSARFAGQLALTGKSLRHHDYPEVQSVCFEADSVSAEKMPRWSGDRRRAWFCFTNTSYAARNLAQPGLEKPAEILVDSFTINRGASDEVNTATLVRVISRTK